MKQNAIEMLLDNSQLSSNGGSTSSHTSTDDASYADFGTGSMDENDAQLEQDQHAAAVQ